MAVTQLSELNSLFNTIYERALFVALEMNLMANLVENRSAVGWMNRVVPTRPAITAVAVGETDDFNTPTTFGRSVKATLTPSEIIAQVVLTDWDMETDPDSAVTDASRELGAAIATKIDVDLLALFGSFSAGKGTAAGTATLAGISSALSVITKNHARQYGRPNVVLHPYQWHDIWVELGQVGTGNPPSEFANQALSDYFVSNMLGASWFTSANIVPDGSDDAVGAVFVAPALMLDTRRAARFEAERDASARAYELNVTAGYAKGIVRQEFGCKYTSDVTEPT